MSTDHRYLDTAFIFPSTCWGRHYWGHPLTEEETEAQRSPLPEATELLKAVPGELSQRCSFSWPQLSAAPTRPQQVQQRLRRYSFFCRDSKESHGGVVLGLAVKTLGWGKPRPEFEFWLYFQGWPLKVAMMQEVGSLPSQRTLHWILAPRGCCRHLGEWTSRWDCFLE